MDEDPLLLWRVACVLCGLCLYWLAILAPKRLPWRRALMVLAVLGLVYCFTLGLPA